MANYYKNAFYAPTTTSVTSVYTAPSNARAIIQNIQVTNEVVLKYLKQVLLIVQIRQQYKLHMLL